MAKTLLNVIPIALVISAFIGADAFAQDTTVQKSVAEGQKPVAEAYICPGTDAEFLAEMDEAGGIGFGETWDYSRCAQGREIYAEGTTARSGFRAFRRRMRPPITEKDVEFYSLIFPIGAFGSLGFIFAAAWLLGLRHRFRKIPQITLSCTACDNQFDIAEPEYNLHSRFCPLCGAGCEAVETPT